MKSQMIDPVRTNIIAAAALGTLTGAFMIATTFYEAPADAKFDLREKDGVTTYSCHAKNEEGQSHYARITDDSLSLYRRFHMPDYQIQAAATPKNIEIAKTYCLTGVTPEV